MTKLANLSCVLTQMEMLDGSGEIIGALFSIIVLSKNREVETSKFSMNESVRTVFSQLKTRGREGTWPYRRHGCGRCRKPWPSSFPPTCLKLGENGSHRLIHGKLRCFDFAILGQDYDAEKRARI